MKKILSTLTLILSVASTQADIFNINLNDTNNPSGSLRGVFETPPNASTATGGEVGAGITYNNATSLLTINLAYGLFGFQPLTGTYTASHIHLGAVGVAAPPEISLASIHTPIGPNAGFYSGPVALNLAQETALFGNLLYINIHSSSFPGGEIRAQLIPSTVPEPSTAVLVAAGIATFFAMRRFRLK